MIPRLHNTFRLFIISAFLMVISTGCSVESFKKWSYRMAREYSCENHGPNLPRKQVKCMEEGMSFEEYDEARRKEIEGEE